MPLERHKCSVNLFLVQWKKEVLCQTLKKKHDTPVNILKYPELIKDDEIIIVINHLLHNQESLNASWSQYQGQDLFGFYREYHALSCDIAALVYNRKICYAIQNMLHSYVIHGNNKKSNIKSITISRTISFKTIIVRRHNSDFIDPKWTEKQLKAISIVLHVISYQKIGTQWDMCLLLLTTLGGCW